MLEKHLRKFVRAKRQITLGDISRGYVEFDGLKIPVEKGDAITVCSEIHKRILCLRQRYAHTLCGCGKSGF